MKELTENQEEVLQQIKFHIILEGIPPTRSELAILACLHPSSITNALQALIQKGFISIKPRISRGIKVLK